VHQGHYQYDSAAYSVFIMYNICIHVIWWWRAIFRDYHTDVRLAHISSLSVNIRLWLCLGLKCQALAVCRLHIAVYQSVVMIYEARYGILALQRATYQGRYRSIIWKYPQHSPITLHLWFTMIKSSQLLHHEYHVRHSMTLIYKSITVEDVQQLYVQ